jgi:hypothetical protein
LRFVGLPARNLLGRSADRQSLSWIDQRTITTTFAAEQTLTSDTLPVNVTRLLFWMVHGAQKAALEMPDHTAP